MAAALATATPTTDLQALTSLFPLLLGSKQTNTGNKTGTTSTSGVVDMSANIDALVKVIADFSPDAVDARTKAGVEYQAKRILQGPLLNFINAQNMSGGYGGVNPYLSQLVGDAAGNAAALTNTAVTQGGAISKDAASTIAQTNNTKKATEEAKKNEQTQETQKKDAPFSIGNALLTAGLGFAAKKGLDFLSNSIFGDKEGGGFGEGGPGNGLSGGSSEGGGGGFPVTPPISAIDRFFGGSPSNISTSDYGALYGDSTSSAAQNIVDSDYGLMFGESEAPTIFSNSVGAGSTGTVAESVVDAGEVPANAVTSPANLSIPYSPLEGFGNKPLSEFDSVAANADSAYALPETISGSPAGAEIAVSDYGALYGGSEASGAAAGAEAGGAAGAGAGAFGGPALFALQFALQDTLSAKSDAAAVRKSIEDFERVNGPGSFAIFNQERSTGTGRFAEGGEFSGQFGGFDYNIAQAIAQQQGGGG